MSNLMRRYELIEPASERVRERHLPRKWIQGRNCREVPVARRDVVALGHIDICPQDLARTRIGNGRRSATTAFRAALRTLDPADHVVTRIVGGPARIIVRWIAG